MYRITLEQKNIIEGQEYMADCIFNPVQDINGDWFISKEEVEQCVNFDWVKNLTESEFIPKEINDIL